MAVAQVMRRFEAMGGQPGVRANVLTDNGHPIVDVRGLSITDPAALEREVNQWPGVVVRGHLRAPPRRTSACWARPAACRRSPTTRPEARARAPRRRNASSAPPSSASARHEPGGRHQRADRRRRRGGPEAQHGLAQAEHLGAPARRRARVHQRHHRRQRAAQPAAQQHLQHELRRHGGHQRQQRQHRAAGQQRAR